MSLKFVLKRFPVFLQDTPELDIGRSWDVLENGPEITRKTSDKKLVDFVVDINPV